ncbi:MAG: hypothetical protein H7323_13835 [Frankiales bacterium]|nr:hypothetical protein [Frankiales bacterium]
MAKSARPQRGAPGQNDPLAGIVGAGGSRLTLDAAMRAREVSAPGPDDLAAAELTVVLKTAYRGGSSPERS